MTDHQASNCLPQCDWYSTCLKSRGKIIEWKLLAYPYSRLIPSYSAGSPIGVWGREWTTCLLYDGSLLGLCFSKWYLMCNFGIVDRILYYLYQLISCLSVLVHYPTFAGYFSSLYIFTLKYFLYQVLFTTIVHRRSLDSFLQITLVYNLLHMFVVVQCHTCLFLLITST